jgi:hypothetical protein
VPFSAQVLNVLIASPGDTVEFRDAIERALHSWNRDRATAIKLVLMPRRWEFDAVPEFGVDAQSVINKQLVDEADIVIGIFYSRLGLATARGASGTAEEIDRAHKAGKSVHVYFAEMPYPPNVDLAQLGALREFKQTLDERGLTGSFKSMDDLVARVRSAVEKSAENWIQPESEHSQGQADLRASFETRLPVGRSKTRLSYITLTNVGDATARNIWIDIRPTRASQAFPVINRREQPDLNSGEKYEYHVIVAGLLGGWVETFELQMSWNQDGKPFQKTQLMDIS